MKRCKDCKWFWDVTPKDEVLPPVPQYECRRYAPQKLHGVGAGYEEKKWPSVNLNDFCGEFEAKNDS